MNLAVMICLLVLIVAFAWVGIELALTVRKMRSRVDDVVQDLDTTIQHIDETVASLQPAIEQVEPIVHKAGTTIDALSLDLLHVNEILGDVKSISGAAAGATNAVTGVVDKAAGAVSGAVSRLAGGRHKESKRASRLDAPQSAAQNAFSHVGQNNAFVPASDFEIDIDDIDDDGAGIEDDATDYFSYAQTTDPDLTANLDATVNIWEDLEIDDLDEPSTFSHMSATSGKAASSSRKTAAKKTKKAAASSAKKKTTVAKKASVKAKKTAGAAKASAKKATSATKKAGTRTTKNTSTSRKSPATKTSARKTAGRAATSARKTTKKASAKKATASKTRR